MLSLNNLWGSAIGFNAASGTADKFYKYPADDGQDQRSHYRKFLCVPLFALFVRKESPGELRVIYLGNSR